MYLTVLLSSDCSTAVTPGGINRTTLNSAESCNLVLVSKSDGRCLCYAGCAKTYTTSNIHSVINTNDQGKDIFYFSPLNMIAGTVSYQIVCLTQFILNLSDNEIDLTNALQ